MPPAAMLTLRIRSAAPWAMGRSRAQAGREDSEKAMPAAAPRPSKQCPCSLEVNGRSVPALFPLQVFKPSSLSHGLPAHSFLVFIVPRVLDWSDGV